MALADYNGWLGSVREARNKPYYAALKDGRIDVGNICAGCHTVGTHDNPVAPHSEEYGSTVDTYIAHCIALCHACHAVIHVRAKYPQVFARYKARIADGAPIPKFKTIMLAFQNIFRGNRPYAGDPKALQYVESGTWLDQLQPVAYSGPVKIATAMRGGVEIPDPAVYPLSTWTEMYGVVVDPDGEYRYGTYRQTPDGVIFVDDPPF